MSTTLNLLSRPVATLARPEATGRPLGRRPRSPVDFHLCLRHGALAWACCLLGTAAQAADAVPGEVMLQLRSSDAIGALLQRHGLSLTGRFGARPIFRTKLVNGGAVDATVQALLADPSVVNAEPNRLHAHPEANKNNPWAIGSAGEFASSWAIAALRLTQVHPVSTGAGVRVAVLDTGVDASHPLLAGRLLPGVDFVDGDTAPDDTGTRNDAAFGHGTHVAGIVATVAPGAKIMPLRVLDPQGEGNAWVLAEALLHAVDPDHNPLTDDGAQVINLSLGTLERAGLMGTIARLVTCTPPETKALEADIADPGYNDDKARCTSRRGAVVVAAAGNNGSGSLRFYPAADSAYGLISVAASTAAGELAGFSNRGNWIDLAAPGAAITSAVPGGYGTWSGTSMAAPMVTGSVALMLARAPSLSAEGVKRCLVDNAAPLSGTKLRGVDPLTALRRPVRGPVCR